MNLRDVITLLIVVAVASVMLFQLLGFAVSLVYPDSDPGELQSRVALVLICLTVLGVVWWVRGKVTLRWELVGVQRTCA